MTKRTYDVVIFGATGFTGRLVAEYLAAEYGSAVRWAMAGRSLDKLAAVRDEIGAPADTPLIAADSSDPASLAAMAEQTAAVITTVGPYQLYGEALVKACVDAGTDYVDLCGEPAWMHDIIAAHDAPARDSGARIVLSCGFDSIPFDLGVYFLQSHAIDQTGAPLARIKGRVRKMKGTFSGGTAASFAQTMARAAKEPLCGPLRLGLIPTIAPYLLPRVLPGLRQEFPELQLFLREEFTHVLVDRLMSGEIDVALLALPVSGDFASQSLFLDDFHLAMPKGHVLADRETIDEADLNHQEVLLLEDGHCLRDQALAICGRAGAAETARFRATSLGTLIQMVAGGMGLTLVPELALGVETGHTTELEVRPFNDPAPHREVGLIWRRASARGEEYQLLGETLVKLLDA